VNRALLLNRARPANKWERMFWIYHDQNPQVFKRFDQMATDMFLRGRRRYSACTIISVIRFEFDLQADDPNSVFKINQNYAGYYARLLLQLMPELPDTFFELRQLKATA